MSSKPRMIKVPEQWFEQLLEHANKAKATYTIKDGETDSLIGYASSAEHILNIARGKYQNW